MKAFLMGVALLVLTSVVAAASLSFVPMSSKDVFIERSNVRL